MLFCLALEPVKPDKISEDAILKDFKLRFARDNFDDDDNVEDNVAVESFAPLAVVVPAPITITDEAASDKTKDDEREIIQAGEWKVVDGTVEINVELSSNVKARETIGVPPVGALFLCSFLATQQYVPGFCGGASKARSTGNNDAGAFGNVCDYYAARGFLPFFCKYVSPAEKGRNDLVKAPAVRTDDDVDMETVLEQFLKGGGLFPLIPKRPVTMVEESDNEDTDEDADNVDGTSAGEEIVNNVGITDDHNIDDVIETPLYYYTPNIASSELTDNRPSEELLHGAVAAGAAISQMNKPDAPLLSNQLDLVSAYQPLYLRYYHQSPYAPSHQFQQFYQLYNYPLHLGRSFPLKTGGVRQLYARDLNENSFVKREAIAEADKTENEYEELDAEDIIDGIFEQTVQEDTLENDEGEKESENYENLQSVVPADEFGFETTEKDILRRKLDGNHLALGALGLAGGYYLANKFHNRPQSYGQRYPNHGYGNPGYYQSQIPVINHRYHPAGYTTFNPYTGYYRSSNPEVAEEVENKVFAADADGDLVDAQGKKIKGNHLAIGALGLAGGYLLAQKLNNRPNRYHNGYAGYPSRYQNTRYPSSYGYGHNSGYGNGYSKYSQYVGHFRSEDNIQSSDTKNEVFAADADGDLIDAKGRKIKGNHLAIGALGLAGGYLLAQKLNNRPNRFHHGYAGYPSRYQNTRYPSSYGYGYNSGYGNGYSKYSQYVGHFRSEDDIQSSDTKNEVFAADADGDLIDAKGRKIKGNHLAIGALGLAGGYLLAQKLNNRPNRYHAGYPNRYQNNRYPPSHGYGYSPGYVSSNGNSFSNNYNPYVGHFRSDGAPANAILAPVNSFEDRSDKNDTTKTQSVDSSKPSVANSLLVSGLGLAAGYYLANKLHNRPQVPPGLAHLAGPQFGHHGNHLATGHPTQYPGYGGGHVYNGVYNQGGGGGYPVAGYGQSNIGYGHSQASRPNYGYGHAHNGHSQAQAGYGYSQSGYGQASTGYPLSQNGYGQFGGGGYGQSYQAGQGQQTQLTSIPTQENTSGSNQPAAVSTGSSGSSSGSSGSNHHYGGWTHGTSVYGNHPSTFIGSSLNYGKHRVSQNCAQLQIQKLYPEIIFIVDDTDIN